MTETREQRAERVYAQAERSLEVINARRVRRGPEVLIGVTVLLALAVGTVAAVDLRRLQTPSGTTLAWTGAAVFGDCTAYDRLSVPPSGPDLDLTPEQCVALRTATESAREQSSRFGIELVSVSQDGATAQAEVRVTDPEGVRSGRLELVRVDDGWAVVRTAEACRVGVCV